MFKNKIKHTLLNYSELVVKLNQRCNNQKFKDLASLKEAIYTGKLTDSSFKDLLDHWSFLNLLKKTSDWSKKWVLKLEALAKDLGVPAKYTCSAESSESLKPNEVQYPKIESFLEYAESRTRILRNILKLNTQDLGAEDSISLKDAFYDLGISKDHSVISESDSFFLTSSEILRSHLTPSILRASVYNVLQFQKCFRRETPDRTHLCEFYQLELSKESTSEDPIRELKDTLSLICAVFGLDLSRIQFRNTVYPYVFPGFELFYRYPSGRTVEIGGCGIMCEQVLKLKNINAKRPILAAGFGLDRLYSIYSSKDDILKIHDIVK